MNSSGIKRGLAATAISALAVTGLPFLATSASAEPIEDQFVDPNVVEFYSVDSPGNTFSAKNDGTNTTVSLVAGGGSNVDNVLFQYQATSTGATWNAIGGAVFRNADGVFATEWATPPADVTALRAVPNTGLANADTKTPAVNAGTAADTVELASEGSKGVFQDPYLGGGDDGVGNDEATRGGEYVGVTGTVSQGTTGVTVTDASHGTGASDAGTIETTTDTASDTFNAVVDIDGYSYSGGTEPNQIALNARALGPNTDTDDAEGSTLYVQTIGSITATPQTQEDVTPADSTTTLTVLDTTGKPVAGAQVFRGGDTDTDGAGPDTDADGAEELVGYTDGRGQVEADPAFGPAAGPGAAGTETYYVNTTDNDAYQPGTDPKVDVTVSTYSPVLAEVDIVNERNRSNFDLDEINETPASDDFTIETRDQRGNLYDETADIAGSTPEYRYIIDPAGPGATFTTAWTSATPTATDGEYSVDGLQDGDYNGADLPEGTYTLEARRPNVSGTGLRNAVSETFKASESDITFNDGASTNAPVNGDKTVTGKLANDDGALAGRRVNLVYTQGAGNDAGFAPESAQPAGVDVTPDAGGAGSTATVTTAADGTFSVVLRDPSVPPNVTPNEETGDLNATAQESPTDTTSLQGNQGLEDGTGTNGDPQGDLDATNDNRDAEADLKVNFIETPEVAAIEVTMQNLDGTAAPGRPVDLDIIVRGEDGVNDNDTTNNPALEDFDVEVSVNKGFLSPNAENVNDLDLAAGHDQAGDLWGFFESMGNSETVSTGDAGQAGAVAAIERDQDFDDNGLATMTVTVKAGDETVTKTIEFDARNVLNLVEGELVPAQGEPSGEVPINEEVDFQLYTMDQFENIVGRRDASISDDSTVADFRTDGQFGSTQTDFTVDGPGITAFSNAPTMQTLTARVTGNESLVGPNETQATDAQDTLSVESDPITWVEAEKIVVNAALTLKGKNNGARADRLFANAINKTEGAKVELFRKKRNGNWKKVAQGIMNAKGNHRFKVRDVNGKKKTTYKAIVEATDDTRRGNGRNRVR